MTYVQIINELEARLARQKRQIDWLIKELAFALGELDEPLACPPDMELVEEKHKAIIDDLKEIE